MGQKEIELYFGFVERCLAEAGFSWEAPLPPLAPPEWLEITRYPARYGVVTLVQAELAGYRHPEEIILGVSTEEADKEGLPTDPAEYEAFQTAWFGTFEEELPEDLVVFTDPISGEPIAALDPSPPNGGGCQGRANEWLAGDASPIVDDDDIASDLDIARRWVDTRIRVAFDQALADERVMAAAEEWGACMREGGWDVAGSMFPGGLRVGESESDLTDEPERQEPGAESIQRAIGDINCQQRVEWLASLRAIEAEYQQETVERVPDLFLRVQQLLDAYSARLAGLRLDDLDG